AVAARALALERPDEKILRLSEQRLEFTLPIWDYFAFMVDDERVALGRRMLKQHSATLAAVERRWGVDRHVIVALWGIESDYGHEKGDIYLPTALGTLACAARSRTRFWREELIAALGLVSRGDLRLEDLHGSWAGAFGHTQFMPTTYR